MSAERFFTALVESAEYTRRRHRFEQRLPGELHEVELEIPIQDANAAYALCCRGCMNVIQVPRARPTTIECGRCGDLTQVTAV